jgi:hypothetical protein
MPDSHQALLQAFGRGLLDPAATPSALFRGRPGQIARRFAIYRGNLAAVWEKSLAAAYPVLRMLVGEEFFAALGKAYGRSHASTSGDVNQFGAALPAFLQDFPHTQDFPYFPDLARLEWAVHVAHYAADATALDAAGLAACCAEDLDGLTLQLRPGHAVLRADWAVEPVWRAHQGAAPQALACALDTPSCALVYRPHWRVEVRALGEGEFAALTAIESGAGLGDALEAGLAADPAFDPASLIPAWLAQGLFAAPPARPATEIPA